MIRAFAILLVFASVVASSHSALAFSTEKGNDMFQGNSSNFTDPDDKQPPFMMQMQGGSQSSNSSSQQLTPSVDPASDRDRYMSMSTGFDHAYQHQGQ